MSHFGLILLVVFAFFYSINCGTFYYFAYGSNLTEKRLKLSSPSAVLYSVATLEGYRLDFSLFNTMWNGSVADIVEDPSTNVTGAIWVIDLKDMPQLDKQEGVDQGWYYPKNVTVIKTDGTKIVARTYEQVKNSTNIGRSSVLSDSKPSNTYLEVIVFGAVNCHLPSDYIGFLVSFPTNGYHAVDSIRKQLGYPFGDDQDLFGYPFRVD